MKSGTIKELKSEYGLPLELRKSTWASDCCFRAETDNIFFESVSGWIYVDGEQSEWAFYDYTEVMTLVGDGSDDVDIFRYVGDEDLSGEIAPEKSFSIQPVLEAYNSLPRSADYSSSVEDEELHERNYHETVDGKLDKDMERPKKEKSDWELKLHDAAGERSEVYSEARENGCPPDENALIISERAIESANRRIDKANDEIARIEEIKRKPYFARVDLGSSVSGLHTAYLGEKEIPGLVYDWRKPEIGNPYYSSELFLDRSDVVLALKRAVTIEDGEFIGYEDEINLYESRDFKHSRNTDALLTKLLAESRSDKRTHDIIKTIQSEQYDIITADFLKNTVVNGCAGSGKTMIMYHRLSYMAYNYKTVLGWEFDPKLVYIVSPSPYFDDTTQELAEMLNIDSINQAPFYEQVCNLIGKYCEKYGMYNFTGLIPLITPKGAVDKNFYSIESFKLFKSILNLLNKAGTSNDSLKNYKKYVFDLANTLLDSAGFKKVTVNDLAGCKGNISSLFSSTDYYRNPVFLRSKQSPGRGFHSPNAVTSISFENISRSLEHYNKDTNFYKQKIKRLAKHRDLLSVCLSPKTKIDFSGEVVYEIPEFQSLLDSASTFEKMLTVIAAQKLLECFLIRDNIGKDLILRCVYILQMVYPADRKSELCLYILRELNDRFKGAVTGNSLVFVDEFQNFSAFELDCLKGAFTTPVFNLYGDYDQRLEEKGAKVRAYLTRLFGPATYNLTVNYRNAKQITEYINKNLGKSMKSIGVRGTVRELSFSACSFDLKNRTAIICKEALSAYLIIKGRIMQELINLPAATGEIPPDKYCLISVADCKGLEFDTVYVLTDGMTETEKYLALTRALDTLVVIPDSIESLIPADEKLKRKEAEYKKNIEKLKNYMKARESDFKAKELQFNQKISAFEETKSKLIALAYTGKTIDADKVLEILGEG